MWLIFGGWAFSPDILRPVFGDDARYVDSNTLMPYIVDDETLRGDWVDVVCKAVASFVPEQPFGIAGWSTGAIIAWAVAARLKAEKVVLLSATPSFCSREEFKSGWRASILHSMREKLSTNANKVVADFRERCGCTNPAPADTFTQAQLRAGLIFLEYANLLPLSKTSMPARLLHGSDDRIVSIDAGRSFAEQTGIAIDEYAGGHVFFLTNAGPIRTKLALI
jgi:surfactin synthase thioesterase subunit